MGEQLGCNQEDIVSIVCVLSPEIAPNEVVAIRSTMGWCKTSADSCVKSLGESYSVGCFVES